MGGLSFVVMNELILKQQTFYIYHLLNVLKWIHKLHKPFSNTDNSLFDIYYYKKIWMVKKKWYSYMFKRQLIYRRWIMTEQRKGLGSHGQMAQQCPFSCVCFSSSSLHLAFWAAVVLASSFSFSNS